MPTPSVRLARCSLSFALIGALNLAHPAAVHAGPRYLATDSIAFAFPDSGSAMVYASREEFVRFNHLPPEHLYVDRAPLGLLPQQSYFWAALPPGRHCISGIAHASDVCFECRAGRTYFLRLQEMILEGDNMSAHLLFDDPQSIPRIVKKSRLSRVTMTDEGAEYLRGRVVYDLGPPGAGAPAAAPATSAPVAMEKIWYEDPLDPVNLKKDFSGLTGRLVLTADTVHYRMRERVAMALNQWKLVVDSLDIAGSQILKISYGGQRFTGTNPWVDISYENSTGVHIASFADSRPEEADATYNRIFELAERARLGARAADTTTAARGAPH